ncbi:hypothetical protein LTR17_023451 [Elasticomyces elasticus]|nr:hypothetical protein LTR17_023451 [Elasticomyces elasticus]
MEALVRKLDGLPLALATTGVHLEQASIHQDDLGLETYKDRILYSTWRISLERIQQQNELSARLLGLWCYFSNQDLWYEVLCDGNMEHLPWLRNLMEDLPVSIEAKRLPCNYGLAGSDTVLAGNNESGGYGAHACVHAWTIHVLNKQWDHGLAGFAVSALSQQVPGQEAKEPWTTQRRLVQHAERCLQYVPRLDATQPEVGDSIVNIAGIHHEQNNMHGAEEMYLRALRGYKEVLGPKHITTLATLATLYNLGIFYSHQGKTQEAEEMYLRALRGYGEVLGSKHTSTLTTLYSLVIFYSDQGRIQETEEMFAQVLEDYQNVEGDHEAIIWYLREQLGTLRAGRQSSSQYLQGEQRNPRTEISSDVVDQKNRTARMRDFVLRVLM